MQNKKLKFPENFLWGVGTSSHQVEGGNENNDWYAWEQKGKTKEFSGIACDSWHRFQEDNDLVKSLNCNAYRISLEWSKIEPEENKFSQEAIKHYQDLLVDMKIKGIKRVVTLNHWTVPLWFSQKYGWHKKGSVLAFQRFVEKITKELHQEIDLCITFNEPRLILNKGYASGTFPPGKKNPILYFLARKNLIEAHKKAYEVIKKVRPNLPVGITQFCNDFDYFGKGRWQNWLTEKVENFYNWHFFDQIGEAKDFVGVNYYYGAKVKLTYPFYELATYEKKVTDMGWGVSPEGMFEVVMDAWEKYKKPIYILENGIADDEDKYRAQYIKAHLRALHKTIRKGVDVRGYFYWSLLDNFEWNEGYQMKFGLFEVDRKTMKRTPRKSSGEYAKICRENSL